MQIDSRSTLSTVSRPSSNGELARSQATSSPKKVNLLLVDDREDKLLALESILAHPGQNLVRARSGKEALRHLLKTDFALILLDVSMPGMDGFETAALIRQRPRTEHTPIIFVTSIGQSEKDVHKGYAMGAVDYIRTPIVPALLRAKVMVFVDLYQKTEQIKEQAEQLVRDNSALKDAERKIQELNLKLAGQLSAVTEVNKELEAFNYSIAHDLRSPLRSVQGMAEILLDEYALRLGAEGAELAQRILRSSQRLDRLLCDLLAYSRLTSAEMPRLVVNLDDLIDDVVSSLEKDISDRLAVLEVQKPLGCALGHPPTIVQIFANLLVNALKFVPGGKIPHIRIVSSRNGKHLRLSVHDNGIGIEPEHHDKIFGLFERLHAGQEYPGTGLGLALVRKGIERMGGRVGLKSEAGSGSTFWVDFLTADSAD
jgi:signal transduction histidine kinase